MTRRRAIASLSICAFLVLMGGTSFGQSLDHRSQEKAPSNQQAFVDLQRSFVISKERGDTDYVKNALADDFKSIESNGSMKEKSDFVHDISPSEQSGPPPILYDFEVLQLNEKTVIVTYCAVFRGNETDKYQHVSDAWTKQANGWKLKFEQSTLNLWSAHDLD